MRYKYLLFDWDGCLARTLDVWFESYKKTLDELGIKKKDKEITAVFGNWQGGTLLGAPDNDKFFERVDSMVKDQMPQIELHNGVKKALAKLKEEGYVLAILSSSIREYLIPAMKYHEILDLFEVVITGEDVKEHKPSPEVIYKAMNKLGGNKKEHVMIGDSDKDVMAAGNAGIDSVLYFPEEHKLFYDLDELIKSKPTFLINKFEEISKILNI